MDSTGLYSQQLWVYLFIMGLLFIDLLLVFLVNFQKEIIEIGIMDKLEIIVQSILHKILVT